MHIDQIQPKMNRFKSEKVCFGNFDWLFESIRKIQYEKDILTVNSWAFEFYLWPPKASNSDELDKQGEPTMQSIKGAWVGQVVLRKQRFQKRS